MSGSEANQYKSISIETEIKKVFTIYMIVNINIKKVIILIKMQKAIFIIR